MTSTKPIIGISTNEIINFGGRQVSHSTGLRYVNAVSKFSNAIPILIPSNIKSPDGAEKMSPTIYCLSTSHFMKNQVKFGKDRKKLRFERLL